MRLKNSVRFYSLLVMGSVLILTRGCDKEEVKSPDDFIYGEVTDVEGNVYKTIRIEIPVNGSKGSEAVQTVTQTWMVENLKTTKYNNGDIIETTTPATLDLFAYLDKEILKYQWAYDGNENYVGTYGRLYTWGAATDSRNICPAGWHVPTEAQWSQLAEFLGGEFVEDKLYPDAYGSSYWTIAGGKLKEAGTSHWLDPNTGATNSIGFTALPGGVRHFITENYNCFSGMTDRGRWWSQTKLPPDWGDRAWSFEAGYATRGLPRLMDRVNNGNSVRCMK